LESLGLEIEYMDVLTHYTDRRAKRSQVPLMNHINEGLEIMLSRGASRKAMKAYCLHPLCQDDESLKTFDPGWYSPGVVMLAMEYRNIANQSLSDIVTLRNGVPVLSRLIKLSPLVDVNEMLVADKQQNYRDFRRYHLGHARARELDTYFKMWHAVLGVDPLPV
jgi:hypothetical protein